MAQLQEYWTKAGPVRSPEDETAVQTWMARARAGTGEPIPLGLVGFATATFALGSVIAGWWPQSSLALVIPVLLVFGGLAQFIAAMWAYARADSLSATAFGSFGAFNVTFSTYFLLERTGTLGATVSYGPLAIWIAGFAFIAGMLALAALGRNAGLLGVLFSLCVGYGLLSAGYFAMQPNNFSLLYHVGGWFLIVSATLAFYTAAAVTLNSSFGTKVLPLGTAGEAKSVVR